MTVIDKVIKQCFKDSSSGFLMMIFGGLTTSIFISFVFTVLFVPVLMILMVVGLYKVAIKLFDRSVYGEDAMFYQALPVSGEQIIVSRIFVGMVALVTFHLSAYGSLASGLVMLGIGDVLVEIASDIALVVDNMGLLLAVLSITYLATVFLEAALAFALITFTQTSKKVGRSSSDKTGLVIVILLLIRNAENTAITAVISLLESSTNIYLFLVVVMVATVVLGGLMCKTIKRRLENNLEL